MFVAIETNGASHIVIHVPHEGSEKSLPALARMLEQNATFVRSNYSSTDIVKPSMSITLSDSFTKEGHEDVIVIKESSAVLDDTFVNATPEVMTSNAKALKREKDENQRIRTELSFTKSQLEASQAQVQALTNLPEGCPA
jgi:hypothetical protein